PWPIVAALPSHVPSNRWEREAAVGAGPRERVQTEKRGEAQLTLAQGSSCVPRPMLQQRPALPGAPGQWPPPAHSRPDHQAAGEHQFLRAALLLLPTPAQPISALPVLPAHLPALLD